ncbi:hypothetical protein EVAR_75656_1 [Eumeta japonica]|uniref:Uncharacterized protein n=1 Tax=Eumeta variegata TaxID=151549 RepID=A0A4C1U0V8_EUMVA|nr:hypothetical protein EVAR_75656_1 [Eumeta japonica]
MPLTTIEYAKPDRKVEFEFVTLRSAALAALGMLSGAWCAVVQSGVRVRLELSNFLQMRACKGAEVARREGSSVGLLFIYYFTTLLNATQQPPAGLLRRNARRNYPRGRRDAGAVPGPIQYSDNLVKYYLCVHYDIAPLIPHWAHAYGALNGPFSVLLIA